MCESVCVSVLVGEGCRREDWGPSGYPEWRREGVEAGGWEACVVLLLSVSLFLHLPYLGFQALDLSGWQDVVCVCVCWAGHSSSFFYGLSYIYRVFYLRVASSMFYMLALPFRIFCSCYFVG